MLERGWPLLQATLAAMVAVAVARVVADQPNHLFAPIAAVVALNGPRGERGRHALRLVVGVFVGIAIAELAILALPARLITLGLASFTAMAVARAISHERLLIVQAGASAILTVAIADGTAGLNRLLDACIGAAVALVFSQVLFSPEPVTLLRKAEASALRELSNGLRKVTEALGAGDMDAGRRALSTLRDVRDRMVELARLRRASPRAARHSAIWHSQRESALEEGENADELDLLGGSCIMLARAALATTGPSRAWMAPGISGFADALAEMQHDPGDRERRKRAANQVLAAARGLSRSGAPDDPALGGALFVARMAAHDIMLFAGAPEEKVAAAIAAIDPTSAELDVDAVPRAPRLPFAADNWRALRGLRRSAGKRPHRETPDADVGSKE